MALLLAAVALVVGMAGPAKHAATPASRVSLTITYWADETKTNTFQRWTLRCGPTSGSLPSRRAACRRLTSMTAGVFAPLPTGILCSQIYGGAEKAVVKGMVGDRRVWSSFRRRNGCEIARWNRFSPWLIPAAGTTT